jgi:hypothetical protein
MICAVSPSRCRRQRSRPCWRRLAQASDSVSISTLTTVRPSYSSSTLSDGARGHRVEADRLALPGRTKDWLKMKDPACEAVKREVEEDWGR